MKYMINNNSNNNNRNTHTILIYIKLVIIVNAFSAYFRTLASYVTTAIVTDKAVTILTGT